MATVSNDLITKFTFLGSLAPLQNFNFGLGKSVKTVGLYAVAAAGAVAATLAWGKSILSPVNEMANLSRETGTSIEKLQEWEYIAVQNNSSAEAVTATISGLSSAIADASFTGGEAFSRLGIGLRDLNGELKTADVILGEVQRAFRSGNFTISQQKDLASQLGIDESFAQTLNLSAASIDKLKKEFVEFGFITSQEGESVIAMNDAIEKSNNVFKTLQRQLALALAPALQSSAESFSEFVRVNREWIIDVAQKTVDFVTGFLTVFKKLAPLIGVVVAAFVGLKIAVLALSIIGTIISSPILLLTSMLLIVEAIVAAFMGGESIISQFFKTFLGFDINPFLQRMVSAVKSTIASISSLFSFFINDLANDEMNVGVKLSSDFGTSPRAFSENLNSQIGGGNVTQEVTININGGDIDTVSKGVSRGLQDNLRSAKDETVNRGGR